jgi:hypothetical protein
MQKNSSVQSKTSKKSLQKIEKVDIVTPKNIQELKKLTQNPTTVGLIEFLTGIIATVVDKPSNLILSGGHLAQALVNGNLYKQFYEEVQQYRNEGKIPDETLNTDTGRTIFVDLLRTIDSETLDKVKREALKTIFFKSVWIGTDEHKQMVAYEYYQVCKKLNSMEILILKTAFSMYKKKEEHERGLDDWDK